MCIWNTQIGPSQHFKTTLATLRSHVPSSVNTVSSIYIYIYIYIYMEWDLRVADREKSEAKHGGPKLRRFQSPCAIFTIRVNMKDRVGRLRLTKVRASIGCHVWLHSVTYYFPCATSQRQIGLLFLFWKQLDLKLWILQGKQVRSCVVWMFSC